MEFYIQTIMLFCMLAIVAGVILSLIFFPLLLRGKWIWAVISLLPSAVFGGWLTAVVFKFIVHRY